MTNKLACAMIGCGRMGMLRAEGIARFGGTVVAAADPDAARAQALAARFPGCRVLRDPSELSMKGLDALFICTPPSERGDLERHAVRSGVALFLEKPLALSLRHAEPLLQAIRSTGAITAVGYMSRYRPSVLSLRSDLERTSVLGATGCWVNAAYQVPWWSDPARSGGPINEQATHLVDLSRFLLGEVDVVSAVPATVSGLAAPSIGASILLEFRTGTVANLFYSCSAAEKRIGFEVFTPAGALTLDGWDLRRIDPGTRQPVDPPFAERYDVFHRETAGFLGAVLSGHRAEILSDVEDASRTQAVVDAIIRALASRAVEPVNHPSEMHDATVQAAAVTY
jgi:myo-inositol 2-dehydrogenase / D-chiro-inositol 1-dehydrogenase